MPSKQPAIPFEIWIKSLAKQIISASVACVVDDKVLIVKANYKDYWTFPGGIADAGEDALRAAVRELQEETGLVVQKEQLQLSLIEVSDRMEFKSYNFVFETQISPDTLQNIKLQEEEIEDYQLVSREQILSSEPDSMANYLILWAKGKTGYYEFKR